MTTAGADQPAPLSAEDVARQVELVLAHTDRDYEPKDNRPTMRGVLHLGAFALSIGLTAVLIPLAAVRSGTAALAVSVYCLFMAAMFGCSALYHRRRWGVRGWAVMKRLDHCLIFLFISGTYTPFGLLAVGGTARWVMLGLVWGGSVLGIALKLARPAAPRWVGVPIYLIVSWPAVFFLPQLFVNAGVASVVLLLFGGLVYTAGAIFYGTHWPNPRPGVFGYHEVFHACTVLAATSHYIAVFLVVNHSPFIATG